MLLFYFSLICLTQSLFGVELSIYKSFTEVRQGSNGVGDYKYQFSKSDYENLIDGSINWEGTPLARQEVYNTVESLQDAQVIVRRTSSCECEKISAKIVEPNSMLLQNLETGAYFYADKQSIEYTSSRPTTEGTTLLLQFESQTTQYNGALSYLIQGLLWKPTYDLSVTGNNDYKLNAYANIENDQQREFTVDKTRLVGGDVQLASGSRVEPSRGFESAIKSPTHMMKPILSSGEQQGLYSYTLDDKYTLRPLSSIRLPFIDIKPKYSFYYKTLAGINSGSYQGVFQKTYDLTPDHFMPAGVITVRDNQVLVGQANLPDVPQNYTQTFSLGQDNDVRYLIKGNLVSKSDENATIAFETYDLDVQIMNFKEKNINVQFAVQSGLQTTIINTTCPSAKVQGNQVNLPFQLEKGESRQCKVVVKVTMS